MLDIREILLSSNEETQNRKDRFSLVGENDGKGNIIFHRHYLYNPKKKAKPIKIPAKDFWGTTDSYTDKTYEAQTLPKKRGKKAEKESKQKVKRLQAYLKDEVSFPKKQKRKSSKKIPS